jgi:esterase/lipase superfamily enzyme
MVQSPWILLRRRKKRALVYVHGYNNDFEDAALRTAQLHYDLGFPGVSCFFSWPSDGTTTGYNADGEDIQVATPHIQQFIALLENQPDIDEVFVLAHSMGNRGVTKALTDLAAAGGGTKICEFILAAPDINATVFNQQIAPNLVKHFPRITIYASNRDRALAGSQWLGGYARAGEIGRNRLPVVTPLEKIDICDATIVDADFWGHAVFGDSPTVMDDLSELLIYKTNADRRRMLEPVDSQIGRFYRLKTR